jgi:Flp pilus assembly protein TadD
MTNRTTDRLRPVLSHDREEVIVLRSRKHRLLTRAAQQLLLLIAAVGLVSCTKTVQDVRIPTPAAAQQRSAVAENIRRQVRNAVDAGEGDIRFRLLRQQLATRPDDLKARLDLARLYAKSGFPDVALEHYRIAAARHPDSEEVAIALARTLASLDLQNDAKVHLEAFAAAHPDAGWETLTWLAILQDTTGDYAKAEPNHRSALKLQPRSAALQNNLGYNLLLQGRFAESATELRKAVAMDPSSALARSNLAIALAGQPAEAVAEWQAVTDPATAHNNLAAVLIERGDYKNARRELELALGYNKDHPAVLGNLQLVSELDGGMIGVPAILVRSPWQRFVRSLGSVFLGSPAPSKAGAAGAGGQQ